MLPRTVETAFARYQQKGETTALAIVFDRTAPELLRLARHLARDAAQAEDLVQATFLTAIEKASQHERGRPVLPWLCGVLANHARGERRRQQRVPGARLRRGDDVRDVHGEVGANELQQHVRDAVGRLPETYRPVLRLWLEHGLEAKEIAATLERPEGTVRAQVTRGLDQLRRLLPTSLAGTGAVCLAAGRGLAAVRATVLAAGAGATTGLASTLAIGGLLMLHHKLAIGGISAAVALLLWLLWPPAPQAPTGSPADGATAVESAQGAVVPAVVPPDDADRSQPQRDTVPAPAPKEPVDADPAAVTTSLLVRVVDASSAQPLVGYGIAIGREDALQAFGRLPNFRATDARGEVRFEDLEPGRNWILTDRAATPFSTIVTAGREHTQVIELPATGRVAGTVTTPDGQPVPGAAVLGVGNWVRPAQLATTDADGRFAIEHAHLPQLLARADGFAPSLAHRINNVGNDVLDVSLHLGTGGRRISGTARDAGGRPLTGATIAILPAEHRQPQPGASMRGEPMCIALCVRTDENGEFATDEVAAGEYLVVAVPARTEVSPASTVVDTTHSDAHADLRTAAPTVVEGRLFGGEVSTAGANIIAFPEQPDEALGYLLNLVGLRTAVVADDGSFRIDGLLAGRLSLRAVRGTQLLAETRLDITTGRVHRWDAVLGERQKLTVQVSAPEPLPPSLMAIVHSNVDGAMPSMAVIDGRGKAQLELARSGPLTVTLATLVGNQITQIARRSDVTADQTDVMFDLHAHELPRAYLRGRLVDAAVAPIAGATVHARRVDDSGLVAMLRTTTAPDGSFALGPLPAGHYRLSTGSAAGAQPLRNVQIVSADDAQLGDVTGKR